MKKISILLLIAIAFLTPLAIYLTKFGVSFSTTHTHWGEFGSYISGVYGSLALVIVTYTTYLTQVQFKRENEDNVFFRLFDSFQNRVEISNVRINEENLSAHQCLKHISKRFVEELSLEAPRLARRLLCDAPESIEEHNYRKLFEAIDRPDHHDTFDKRVATFINQITSTDDTSKRWEILKSYIGSNGCESEKIREALESIGSVSFYKIPFETRKTYYQTALENVTSDYGELLDGYWSHLLFIVKLTEVANNRDVYVKYIQAQLTRYDFVIVFYMLAGQAHPYPGTASLKKLGILNHLKSSDCRHLMFDSPTKEKIEVELQYIFSR